MQMLNNNSIRANPWQSCTHPSPDRGQRPPQDGCHFGEPDDDDGHGGNCHHILGMLGHMGQGVQQHGRHDQGQAQGHHDQIQQVGNRDRASAIGNHDRVSQNGNHDRAQVVGSHDTVTQNGRRDTAQVSGNHDRLAIDGNHDDVNLQGNDQNVMVDGNGIDASQVDGRWVGQGPDGQALQVSQLGGETVLS